MTYLVNVNDRGLRLADSEFRGLESQVLQAVRAGGAFVEVDDLSVGPVRVLVTASSSVASRQESVAEELAAYDVFPDVAFLELP